MPDNYIKKIFDVFRKSVFIKNFSALAVSNILVAVLTMVSSIKIARCLEPSGYGLYNIILIQASFWGIFSAFGLRLVIIRTISRQTELSRYLFHKSLKIKIIPTFISIIAAILYNVITPNSHFNVILIVLLISQLVFTTVWDSIESIFMGNQKMQAPGFISLFFTALWVAIVYIIPAAKINVNTMVLVQVIIQAAKTVTFYWWLKNTTLIKIQDNNYSVATKNLLKESFPYVLLALFTTIQNQIPVMFLDYNSSLHELGIFNLGYRILNPMQLLLNIAMTALFPGLSLLIVKDKENFDKTVKKVLLVILFLGIIGSVTVTLFSKEVIVLLYGVKFVESAKIVAVQCWYTVLFSIFCIIGTVLSAMDKQNLLAKLSFFYAVIATPILWYGSRYGAFGLSVAFFVSACINMVYHWIVFARVMPKKVSLKYSLLILFLLVGSIVLIFQIPESIQLIYKFIIYAVIVALLVKVSYSIYYNKLRLTI